MQRNPPASHPAYLTRPAHQVFPEDIDCVFDSDSERGAIFVGNLEAAENLDTLKKHKIGSVLTACKNIHIRHPKEEIPFTLYIPGEDHQEYDLSLHFDTAADFIHQSLRQTNILVHCMAGISRSATLVLAYLIKYHGLSLQQAFSLVTRKRGKINPNSGFVKQLQRYEQKLRGSTGRPARRGSDHSQNRHPPSYYSKFSSQQQLRDKRYERGYGSFFENDKPQVNLYKQAKNQLKQHMQNVNNPEYLQYGSQLNLRHSLNPETSLYQQERLKRQELPFRNHTNFTSLGADFSIDNLSKDLEDRIAKIKQKYYQRTSYDHRSIQTKEHENWPRGGFSITKTGQHPPADRQRQILYGDIQSREVLRNSLYNGTRGFRPVSYNQSFMGSYL